MRRALVSSLDYVATLQRVAELSVGRSDELCIFDVLDEATVVRRIAWAHVDPDLAASRRTRPLRAAINADDHPIIRVIHTGGAGLRARLDDADAQSHLDGERLAMMRKLTPIR